MIINFRTTPENSARYHALARRHGVNLSDLIRLALDAIERGEMNPVPPPPSLKRIVKQAIERRKAYDAEIEARRIEAKKRNYFAGGR